MCVDGKLVDGGGAGFEPRTPKGTDPGVAGEDRREEPPNNHRVGEIFRMRR